MYYYIDGYNLLFRMIQSKNSLKNQRELVVTFLQKEFAQLKMSGLIVFDGKHRRDEESGLFYPSPLEVAYAPKGQTADHYIIERLEMESRPSLITVVTDDKSLQRAARAVGAKTETNGAFIRRLEGKKAKKKERRLVEPKDSKQNMDRLLKIFEKKLQEGLDDN